MQSQSATRISRFLSLVLRHKPETVGLILGEGGWVDVGTLLEACRAHGNPISPEELQYVVANNDKKRFAMSEDGLRIRASQGHSFPVDLGLSPAVPPDWLFHGTAARTLDAIRHAGLGPRSRQHVHLSANYETAVKVGRRHGKPVVLIVYAGKMHRQGHPFFLSDNGVWLTDSVASEYLLVPPEGGWKEVRSCGVFVMCEQPHHSFLLMKHVNRYDLPKGHLNPGETEQQCALRELEEETGITASDITLDPGFRSEHKYLIPYKREGGAPVLKTLVVFLGRMKQEMKIRVTEHRACEWVAWAPPHTIQTETIDPLLRNVEMHLSRSENRK